MYEYKRSVYYYETDSMGVVHHSNYVRWMEEARIAYYAQIGMPYEVTESLGIFSPVTGVSLQHKSFARFGEHFAVRVRMTKYSGVRYTISYRIVNQDGVLLAQAQSEHAFVSKDFRPVTLSKAAPHLHESMKQYIEPDFAP